MHSKETSKKTEGAGSMICLQSYFSKRHIKTSVTFYTFAPIGHISNSWIHHILCKSILPLVQQKALNKLLRKQKRKQMVEAIKLLQMKPRIYIIKFLCSCESIKSCSLI